ncbi:MAG: glycosyltransferase family 4 protein [Chloroflexi bacterium]|nr:glycosyltransferase family 4 protein [Chloroflexota bacterium]
MPRRALNLLFVGPKIPYPANDGGRIAIFEPMRHLAARGHRVAYLGFGSQEAADALKEQAALAWARAIQHDTRTSLVSIIAGLPTSTPYTAGKYRSSDMGRALSSALVDEDFDLVQLEQTHMGWYIPHVKHSGAVPLLRLQNIESELMMSFARQSQPLVGWYAQIQARRMAAFEAEACRRVDACLAISEEDARWVRRTAPATSVFVVPAGSAVTPVRDPNLRIGHSILFIGALDWMPNAQGMRWFAKHVWPRIKQDVPLARCVVIGRNPPADLRAWGETEPGVEVLGFVEDVADFRYRANVEIAPILSGGGMRVKILDAFAHGNAVVSTSLGAVGIEARNDSEILLADSEADFARQVVRLLLNPDLQRKVGDSARARVAERYNWEGVTIRQEEAYYSILAAGARAPKA